MEKQQQFAWFTSEIIETSQKLLFEDVMELEQGIIASITQGRILNLDDMHSDEILTISTIGVTHPRSFMYDKKCHLLPVCEQLHA